MNETITIKNKTFDVIDHEGRYGLPVLGSKNGMLLVCNARNRNKLCLISPSGVLYWYQGGEWVFGKEGRVVHATELKVPFKGLEELLSA